MQIGQIGHSVYVFYTYYVTTSIYVVQKLKYVRADMIIYLIYRLNDIFFSFMN